MTPEEDSGTANIRTVILATGDASHNRDNPLSPARLAMAGETLEALAKTVATPGHDFTFAQIGVHDRGMYVGIQHVKDESDAIWTSGEGDTFPEAVAALLGEADDAG